jgi:regulator of protease activity HflC (stomatin/prohibitin superfamily)
MIILLFVALLGIYIVDVGEKAVLLTWGNPSPTPIGAGIHLKIPIAQNVIKVPIRTQKYEVESSAASKDLQVVTAKIATNYHILPEAVVSIYSTLGEDYEFRVLQPLEQESVKATTAQFTAEELITKREAVRSEIKKILYDKLESRGIIVEDISIVNFDFSPEFNKAIELKVTAEQNALAAKNKLEQIKFEAEQVVAAAEGQAKSINLINEQLKQSPNYIEYQKILKWNGALPQITGSAVPFINVGQLGQTTSNS